MNTLKVLQKLDKETPAEVYLVGGFVRDFLRNEKNPDLDVVIRELPAKKIQTFLRKYGKTKNVKLSKIRGGFNVNIILFQSKGDNIATQIRLPARGKKQIQDPTNSLRQDAAHRDFTINALYMPINATSRSEIIDVVGGKADLALKRIKAVGDAGERIKEHPGRIMRAISLSARTGFRIDEDVLFAITKNTKRGMLRKIHPDLIRSEFNHILLCDEPSRYIKLLSVLGILRVIMPELEDCIGVTQNKKYHKWDVFHHCIYTSDNLERDLVLRLAGLLHDIGKPVVRDSTKEKGITFHNHERASVKLATNILNRLGYDTRTKEKVLKLVRLHMYHYTEEYTDGAIRRFINRAGIVKEDIDNLSEFPLFKLRAGERLGNGFKKIPITARQKKFESRIVEIFNKSKAMNMKDLDIDGETIMSVFNLKPSKIVGQILRYLLNKVINNQDLNKEDKLIQLTAKFLHRKTLKRTSNTSIRTAETM